METDYWNALDQRKIAETIRIEPSRLGVSTHPMKEPLSELKAKSFMGTSRVEIGFAGKEKGAIGKGAFSPEMIGKTARESIRELAKLNEIELTTHATIGVSGFSGLTEKGFSEQEREKALFEIKRTVDFAADTTQGGPIVVHTGEFPRPIYREGEKFEAYEKEKEKMPVYLVDKKTGNILSLPKDIEINLPTKFDEEKGTFEFEKRTYDYYENPENRKRLIEKFRQEGVIKPDEEPTPAQLFYLDYLRKDKEQYAWEERRWGSEYERIKKEYDYYNKALESISKIKDKEMAEYNAIKQVEEMHMAPPYGSNEYDIFLKDPIKFLEKSIQKLERQMIYYRDASTSYGERVRDTLDKMKQIKPIEQVAVEKSAETIARSALYAFEVEKKRDLKKPLFIAPENIFPETYGAHPQELRNLILKSREVMANRLKTQGYPEEEAKKIATEHIKATFDIGHAYTWKKYFKGSDKEFNAWLKQQVSQLAKEGIIGHVHLSDNFGYYDEHLAPGEGSVPIKEFAKEIEEQGYKGPMIVEAGAQPEGTEYEVLTGAFRTLQSPIYRIDALSQTWSDIQQSYFARTSGTPGYLVGDYVPSKDWTLWTEVPLE